MVEFNLNSKVTKNPSWIVNKEFDGWSVMFNPAMSKIYTLNETGTYIFEKINDQLSIKQIICLLKLECEDLTPSSAIYNDIINFLKDLENKEIVSLIPCCF